MALKASLIRHARCRVSRLATRVLAVSALMASVPAHADATLTGYITRVSYAQDAVLIMLSSGVPSNCTGVSYNWLTIPAQNKAMQAFVTGLWMRGDAASKPLAVYTSGISAGSCLVNQIDTESAG